MDLIDVIYTRRSIRSYVSNTVDGEMIETLLKAAMSAPSGGNRKPWHFIVVTDRRKLDELVEAHPYAKMLLEAPLCIAVCGDPSITERYWVQDCSAATENLLLAAVALGLGAVWIGVYPLEERIASIQKVLKIPEDVIPLNLIPVGYPAEEKEARTQFDESRVHYEGW